MSRLSGHEPRHWHDAQGRHRMTDPRTLDWWQPRFADMDEKRYAAHLEAHEGDGKDPEPLPGDLPAVNALFEHIASLEATIVKEKLLITALRQQAVQTPEHDDKED